MVKQKGKIQRKHSKISIFFKIFLGKNVSAHELMITTISDVVKQLIDAYEQGKDIDLNKYEDKQLNSSHLSSSFFHRVKCKASAKYGLSLQPRLVDIIAAIPESHKKVLLPKIKAKPVRTASGIVVVAVMCKPHRCPHIAMTGNICVYCPGGPDSDFEYSTQSYTGYEVFNLLKEIFENFELI